MTTGSTLESLPSLVKSIFVPTPESDCSLISMVVSIEEKLDLSSTIMPQPRSSDGVSNNWRSLNWSRKIRKEIISSLTPVFYPLRAAECWTELLLNTLKRASQSNDVKYNDLSFMNCYFKNYNFYTTITIIHLSIQSIRLWENF